MTPFRQTALMRAAFSHGFPLTSDLRFSTSYFLLPNFSLMLRIFRTSLLILPLLLATVVPPSARAIESQESAISWRTPSDDFIDGGFSSGFELFYAGPEWFLNALSNPRSRNPFVKSFLDDSAGDRLGAENGYVGTLRDVFDVGLFSNIATFVGATGSKTPVSTPLADSVVYAWNTTTTSTSWLNATNWTGNAGHYPGIDANASSTADGAADDIASIGVTSAGNGGIISINFGNSSVTGVTAATGASGSLTTGAIDLLSSANRSVVIGGSSTAAGTLTLTGVPLNGIANTILANEGSQTLTLQPTASGSGVMSIALGNTTDNVIQVNGAGGITISANVSGLSKNLTKTGPGILTLSGTNNYTGDTKIAGGELILTPSGSLSGSSTIRLGDTSVNSPSAKFRFGDTAGGETLSNAMIAQASASGTEGKRTIFATGTNGNTNTYSGIITMNTGLLVQSANSGASLATSSTAGIFLFQGGSINFGTSTLTVNASLDGNNADTYSIQGTVRLNEPLTSSLTTGGSIVKDGSGTLIIQSTGNTYTGTDASALNTNGTRIGTGILAIYGDTSLGLAPATGTNNVFFTTPGTNVNLDSIGPTLRADASSFTLAATRNINIASTVTARFDSNGNTFGIAGVINGSGGNLNKIGAGTLVLTGNNTYSGTTLISAGTLNAAATGALGGTTGSITVNKGGTLMVSGTGNLDRINDSTPINLGGGTGADPIFARSGTGVVSEGTGAVRTGPLPTDVSGTSTVGLGALSLQSNATFNFGTDGVGTFIPSLVSRPARSRSIS